MLIADSVARLLLLSGLAILLGAPSLRAGETGPIQADDEVTEAAQIDPARLNGQGFHL